MSRIGKLPVVIPAKVKVAINGLHVKVEGPLGTVERTLKGVNLAADAQAITVSPRDNSRTSRALWGLSRTLVQNMVTGVSTGFERVLEINGVGYRAEVKGEELVLTLGKSHPVIFPLPTGVKAEGKQRDAGGDQHACHGRRRDNQPPSMAGRKRTSLWGRTSSRNQSW